ncbi:ComF family protein [Hyphococcus flavus]|uniref:ComF family protein n=1 Tax=Hyphococcus flavus TaxID=1866326 RepID=A0AAE9ZAW1_9PROT|nr:ComF family protein [Hyphococcus flavus]WDI30496.1 ComF family protein [Hyphococcus flavus]
MPDARLTGRVFLNAEGQGWFSDREFDDLMMKRAKSVAASALDLAMPPLCPVTQDEVSAIHALSATAWASAHFIEEPYCPRCGVPFATDYGEGVECPSCIAEPPDFECARAALVYDDASHRMIVGFKHSDRTELASMFARWMIRAGSAMITSKSIITPIPLHKRRLFARRYNQSALLVREIARQTNAPLSVGEFVRKRATPPQKDLSREGRKRNVAGAFGFKNDTATQQFRGAHVVLVDDVLTTGATLSAAARALKRAGASRVDALVLARVVKGGIGAI